MIQFSYLWALLALLSIPILIILYSLRPKRRKVTLSSTHLWREVLNEQQRGLGLQKLLRNLSLILLLLFALLLSLGLTNPQWLSQTAEQYDSVLILDISASMQARSASASGSRFDMAKQQAHDLIAQLADGARMAIMSSGRNPLLHSAFESNKDTLRSILTAIEASDEAGEPRAALALALSLMRNRERGHIYFITDAAFDTDITFASPLIEYLPVSDQNITHRNAAITQFDFRPEIGSEERFQMLLTVRNYSQDALTLPTTVTLNRQQIVSQNLQLPAADEQTLVLPIQGRAYGQAIASIDIVDDLAVDNQAYAVIGVNEGSHVLLVSQGNYYLQSLLAALPNIHLTTLDKIDEDFISQVRHYDLIILDRMQPTSLPPGNYLLIDTLVDELPFSVTDSISYPLISGQSASPLVAHVDLSGVRINQAKKIALKDTDNPNPASLQKLFWSKETDLAITYLNEQWRLVYLGFDLNDSNLPLQAAFPLLISQALAWLHPQTQNDTAAATIQLAAGEPFAIRLAPQQTSVIVTSPTGDAQIYQADSDNNAGTVLLNDIGKVGIYRYNLSGIERQFAVNLTDDHESNITPRAVFPQQREQVTVNDNDRTAQLTIALWPYIATIALLMLSLEWCLWCMRRGSA